VVKITLTKEITASQSLSKHHYWPELKNWNSFDNHFTTLRSMTT